MAAVFAVEALTREEAADYLEHLQVCGVCRSLVGEFKQAADALPDLLAVETASPGLKGRVLDQARSEVERPPASTLAPPAREVRRPSRWHWPAWLSPVPATAIALLAVAVTGLLVWNVTLRQEVDQQTAVLLQHQVTIGALASGGQVFHIPGTDAAPQAAGVLIQEPGNQRAILIVAGLPSLPSGKAYQIWRVRDDGVAPLGAGTLQVTDSDVYGVSISATFKTTDTATQLVVIPATITAPDAIGISVEPVEGSTAPTGDIVLLGKL